MDFAYTSDQLELRKLASKIFSDLAPAESLPNFEHPADRHDPKLWKALANAGLLGVAVPESYGGLGLGMIELALLCQEAGRALAPAPIVPTLAMAGMPIANFGGEACKKRLLGRIASGDVVATAALMDADSRCPESPSTVARRKSGGWRLTGTKVFVPSAAQADAAIVSARNENGAIFVCVLDPHAPGVTLAPQATTTGEFEYEMVLENVQVADEDVLGDPADGADVLAAVVDFSLAAVCATELGVAERAVEMTAKYTSERKQFDKPIASFQAVAQRAADAYIDVDAIRLATQQAVWRLSQRLPARRELNIAKFWASEGGHRACYAAQHLHGGIGVDTDYPLHHYYLRSRQLELTLGGSHTQLAHLGARLADGGAGPT